jgi:hypothetical protein
LVLHLLVYQNIINHLSKIHNKYQLVLLSLYLRDLFEQRVDFSDWVPDGFGTADVVILSKNTIHVIDLKFGKGIPVDAKDNSQMRLYGLGAFNELSDLYDIKRVRMTVLQPRLANYSSEELLIFELLRWADEAVVPAAKLAWAGEGVFVPGPHCSSSFCKARFTCSARAEGALTVARQEFTSLPPATGFWPTACSKHSGQRLPPPLARCSGMSC